MLGILSHQTIQDLYYSNIEQTTEWIDADLEGMTHIKDIYIVTSDTKKFKEIKSKIIDLLGPYEIVEEESRALSDGLPANVEYFKLNFLDKDQISLGYSLHAILPLLWLRSGSVGPRPQINELETELFWFIPENSNFAILLDETYFSVFKRYLLQQNLIEYVYLVTDSIEAYVEMNSQLKLPNVIQLYKDYLENFMINKY